MVDLSIITIHDDRLVPHHIDVSGEISFQGYDRDALLVTDAANEQHNIFCDDLSRILSCIDIIQSHRTAYRDARCVWITDMLGRIHDIDCSGEIEVSPTSMHDYVTGEDKHYLWVQTKKQYKLLASDERIMNRFGEMIRDKRREWRTAINQSKATQEDQTT